MKTLHINDQTVVFSFYIYTVYVVNTYRIHESALNTVCFIADISRRSALGNGNCPSFLLLFALGFVCKSFDAITAPEHNAVSMLKRCIVLLCPSDK